MTISSLAKGFLDDALIRYRKHEHIYGWLFFLSGIVWDVLTLRRIDNIVDNAILLSYLALLIFIVVSDILIRADRYQGVWLDRIRPWMTPIAQFLLGALLSAIVIFYARSVAWGFQLGFWMILVVSLIANEFMHRRMNSITPMLVMVCGSLTFILAWLYPVMAGSMSPWLFRLASVTGLAISFGVLYLAVRLGQARVHRWGSLTIWSLVLFVTALNLGYEYDWIPPVPMSVKVGGVFQKAEKVGDEYNLEYLTDDRYVFFPSYGKTFFYEPGDTVSCFTSIFAPTEMNERIFHVWEKYDEDSGTWRATDRISFAVSGGRDLGYRGLTRKRNVTKGEWRIVVETSGGKTLSRIPFTVVPKPEEGLRWIERVK